MPGVEEMHKGTMGEWVIASFAASLGASTGPLHPDPGVDLALFRGPMGRAEIQVKTTAVPDVGAGVLRFGLSKPHFDALIEPRRIPLRLAVVVTTPDSFRRWRVSQRAVTFPGTVVYADPGVPPLWDARGHNIWIPLTQRLTPQVLEGWLT